MFSSVGRMPATLELQAKKAKEDEELNAITEDNVSETLYERFVGLSEVLPETLVKATGATISVTVSSTKWSWKNGKDLAWKLGMVAVL